MKGYINENKEKGCFVFVCLGILLLSAGCNLRPSNSPVKKAPTSLDGSMLSVVNMQSDLSVLLSAIKEVHPGYGIYTSADRLEKKYEEVRSSLHEPMSEKEYISHLYPFLCALGCGHTQIKHSTGYHSPVDETAAHLPFEVLVRGQRVWVTTRKTAKLATGDEIISMNDVPVATIVRNGYLLYCGDGYVESFKELYLSEYDGFEDVCNMHYHWTPPYRLTVRSSSGILKNITLDATDTAQVDTVAAVDKYAEWTKSNGTGDLGLYFYKHNTTALLEVREFVYADTMIYGKCFDQIALRGAKNLILDMRHNGGGDIRIAIRLLSFLLDADFGIIKDLYSRLPDPSANSFSNCFDPELTESFKGSCIPGRSEGGCHHMDVRPEFGQVYGPIPPARINRFRGKLIVLVDGATFSSAALFVSALKTQCSHVRFVGRETAGAEEGCNGFAMQKLTLPATHVIIQFPWLHVVSIAKSSVHGRGLFPDYVVDYSPKDVVTGTDPDLSRALTLLSAANLVP